MHEMALVREVIGIVLDKADEAQANRVEAVYLRIGQGRDIVTGLFDGLFEHMAKGTVAEGAELVFERVPMLTRCDECGKLYRLDVHDERSWPCPRCGSKKYRLFSGMEFSIDRIEVA